MRLDRFLSGQTALSRRELTALIRSGAVTVNGASVRKPETPVTPETDRITLKGAQVEYEPFHYILMHKPCGILTAARDAKQQTVMDLLKPEDRLQKLAPVGRLDRDTSGLLLITDDGQLAHQVLSPKHHVTKYYAARLRDPFQKVYISQFYAGIMLREGDREEQALPAECVQLDERTALLAIQEGRYHQVRRMFAAAGNFVEDLLRLQIGGLFLPPDLPAGGTVRIFHKETASLWKKPDISEVKRFFIDNYSSYWIKDTI